MYKYIIRDNITDQYLSKNTKDGWGEWSGYQTNHLYEGCLMLTSTEIDVIILKLQQLYKDEPGGIDFEKIKVKPKIVGVHCHK